MAFRVNIVHATVTVLANDSDPKSQAIELSIKEIGLSSQSVLTFEVKELGMAFGRMDKPDARVRFLDDLNVALSLDTRRRGSQQMTSFQIEIPDAVIFRASYSDIMLITDIVNKAIAVANKALSNDKEPKAETRRRQSSGGTGASSTKAPATTTLTPEQRTLKSATTRRSSVSRRKQSIDKSKVLVSKEQLTMTINGFQFVMIGDLQEMPMVHLSTNEFSIEVSDWSGDVCAF
jgi:vacuolar protein sorting-associated protein 13A/C